MTRSPFHEAGPERWWSESWHLDAARGDGTGLTVRLERLPNRGVAWFWAYLVLPDLPGPVVVRDHEVPLPRQNALEVRADGLWAELWCETPLEHWTYGLEAFAVALDDPADALTGEPEIGERIPIGLDIEWELDGPTHERGDTWPRRGVVQSGIVHGEVLLGRSRIELECGAEWRHSWGVRDWNSPQFKVWARGPDVALHVGRCDGVVDGFVARGGGAPEPIVAMEAETQHDRHGLPTAGRTVVNHEIEVDIEVLGLAPLRIGTETLARALCRYVVDGAEGFGWATVLDPREDAR